MSSSVAANFSPEHRKNLALETLVEKTPISNISDREKVSRKFFYKQKQKAETVLTKTWLI